MYGPETTTAVEESATALIDETAEMLAETPAALIEDVNIPSSNDWGRVVAVYTFPELLSPCDEKMTCGKCRTEGCPSRHKSGPFFEMLGYIKRAKFALAIFMYILSCQYIADVIVKLAKNNPALRIQLLTDEEMSIREISVTKFIRTKKREHKLRKKSSYAFDVAFAVRLTTAHVSGAILKSANRSIDHRIGRKGNQMTGSATIMATQAAPAPLLQVICFSMDRVFQLSEYLRTLHTHARFRGVAMRDAFAPSFARVAVICRCTSAEIRARYEAIERQYACHNVTFMYESEAQSFADCLLRSINNGGMAPRKVRDDDADSAEDAKSPYVMFNVDDAFYFDDVELADAFAFLDGEATNESAWPFAFHVKLAPSIWRSHLTNKPMLPLPPMQTVVQHKSDNYGGGVGDSSSSVVPFEMAYHVFDPSRGALDWNYPWELSGSVYLRETAERVVTEIQAQFGKKGINHPNHLELRGHQVVQQWTTGSTAPGNKKKRLQCACSLSPKMHVFAINQVQDVFNNRLYEDETDSLGGSGGGGDLTNLLRLYNANETLDESFYRRNRLSSVHIGTLVLKARAASSEVFSQVEMQELVSVVIPVFNVAKYVEQALRSIMNQTYEHLEILVVDDASTDATSEIIARLQTQDARIQHIRNATNLGVATSLNKGFALAKGAFVARMDGDDVSLPERIERQVHYLRENPQVAIVGASVLILREGENPDSRKDNLTKLETAVYPTSPLITKWRMLFGCFVGHPTVMLRREVLDILASGVAACSSDGEYYYSTSQTSSEDYELWLRCLYSHGLTVQSMGDALVIHRKHPRNVSKVRREQQISETQAIATKFIQSITSDSRSDGAEPSSHHVLPLFDVNASDSVNDLSSSISVLQKLESEVCQSLKGASKATNDELDCEREYISQDAASREGELALKSMLLDPIRGTQLWSSFASKHPQVSRSAFEKLFKK